MIRRIINIDEDKCTGCGACAAACHEGAIAMVDGKARLIRDDYCDGMGDCLPECPAGAISFQFREAAAYDAAAVAENKRAGTRSCPGSAPRTLSPAPGRDGEVCAPGALKNWPVQIKLAPISAPYFDGAHLLVAADCTAYAYAGLHRELMEGRITLIGCPKLDGVDYGEKLGEILRRNSVEDVTVVRMEVPCCGGLEAAVRRAVSSSGADIPCRVVTVTIDGKLKDMA